MKKILIAILTLSAAAAFAADVPAAPKLNERSEKLLRDALPACSAETTVDRQSLMHKLPPNMTGIVVRVDSKRAACQNQWVGITTAEGDFYMGIPWFLDDTAGTPEERLKAFSWKAMQENVQPVIAREKTRDGLFKVTLLQATEAGKLPLEGEMTPDGSIFFLGHFMPQTADYREQRLKNLQPFIAASPVKGSSAAPVTVVEFSDFECPSCQHAAHYLDPILAKWGDKVRYVRYDVPLVSMHPWAFQAALAGRAIYRQKPDLFWEYKKQIYANQDKLNGFTAGDFERGFAEDHGLDIKKFDADMNSAELKDEILKGVGTAFVNDVRGTPTYFVNGVVVDAGNDGKALEEYVGKLMK
jgi:protein-disulfide isomerase